MNISNYGRKFKNRIFIVQNRKCSKRMMHKSIWLIRCAGFGKPSSLSPAILGLRYRSAMPKPKLATDDRELPSTSGAGADRGEGNEAVDESRVFRAQDFENILQSTKQKSKRNILNLSSRVTESDQASEQERLTGITNEKAEGVDKLGLLQPRQWTPVILKLNASELLSTHLQLSKARLSALVTVTAVGGYLLAPAPFALTTFLSCVGGTALMSAGANAFNQFLEAPYDAQMKRTQTRVLVLDKLSPLHAAMFGSFAAGTGFALLYLGANPLTALLGLGNIGLYAGVYTPLKRHSILCTWAGAVVGAIPPLMGYAACCGHLDSAALVLAAVLYAWQFPHFNGLSWNLRSDYSRAGYRVMCVTDQKLCRTTTLRYSLGLVGLCSIAAPLSSLTSWDFAMDSLLLNGYMTYLAYVFYSRPDANTSRSLFRFSLLHLPMLMMFMFVSNFARRSFKSQ